MFCRFMKIAACLILSVGVFTISATAAPITYQWQGDNGFTGFFTINGTALTPDNPEIEVSQTELTAFSFSGPSFTFGFSDVDLNSALFFDTTVNPPTYLGGGGDAAIDAAGNRLIFFNSEITYSPVGKQSISSSGTFVVASTPEPATWPLMLAGLAGCFAAKRRLSQKPL